MRGLILRRKTGTVSVEVCNFHIFRLFGFGKEEGDVSRFMVTMCFCHDHQRSVIYVLSYVSVVVDFLQLTCTIIWKSLFAAVCAR